LPEREFSRMLRIALTGGIGSGKSLAAKRFAAHGIPVIDADLIARELVTPGSVALTQIATSFGPEVLQPDGTLDRRALRHVVFKDREARAHLETILHPMIRREMERRMESLKAPYVVLVIPLLLETGQTELADRVLVVDTPESAQVARVCHRDGQSAAEVRAVMASQCSRQERLAAADDVIDNSGSEAALLARVDDLHARYLALAGH
jgi:dephospho-CoA kinase